jgi:hypothetical protein
LLVRISFLAYGDPSPKTDWRRDGSERPGRERPSTRSPASGDLGSDVVQMRQPRRYPNGQVGVECLVELLLEPVDRRLRQKVLGRAASR